jgi:hypothetical protein
VCAVRGRDDGLVIHAVEETVFESSKVFQIGRPDPVESPVAMINIIFPPTPVEEFAALVITLGLVVEGAIAAPQACEGVTRGQQL